MVSVPQTLVPIWKRSVPPTCGLASPPALPVNTCAGLGSGQPPGPLPRVAGLEAVVERQPGRDGEVLHDIDVRCCQLGVLGAAVVGHVPVGAVLAHLEHILVVEGDAV